MNFLSNLWKYMAVLLAGVITGMVAAIKLIEKPSVLNVSTQSFIAQQTRKIGKLKQRGEGNSQDVFLLSEVPTRKEKRMTRRAERCEKRLKNKAHL